MPFLPLKIPPGMVRAGTRYQTRGRWFDGSLVRWYEGVLQNVRGWVTVTDDETTPAAVALDSKALEMLVYLGRCFICANEVCVQLGPVIVAGTATKLYALPVWEGLTDPPEVAITHDITPTVSMPTTATYWSIDTFGEDIVAVTDADLNPQSNGGQLFYWDSSEPATPAAALENAPKCRAVVVTPERFVVALAAGTMTDHRRIEWSNQDDPTTWEDTTANQAGGFTLTTDGKLLVGMRARLETLLWTTTDLWGMQYIGGDLVYAVQPRGFTCGAISARAVQMLDGKAVWMGRKAFFAYDGFVKPIPCEIADFVFHDATDGLHPIDALVWSTLRPQYGEVWWFYRSAGNATAYQDRYVTFNYVTGKWAFGALARTAGTIDGVLPYPVMSDESGNLYFHETGVDYPVDGGSDLVPYIESGPVELGEGDLTYMIRHIIPDEKAAGSVSVKLYGSYYPNNTETEYGPYTLTTSPVSARLSARQVRVRLEFTDEDFRVGTFRLDVAPRGRR